jgi:hypothetical protein
MDALELVARIPGWLDREDAEKLFELAYATTGPILEIGTFRGKSAVLMALARKQAGREGPVYTLEVEPMRLRAAAGEALARGVADMIVFVRGTSRAFARAYPHLRPVLTFVDGDHTRAGVQRDLSVLATLVPAEGWVLFHDFYEHSNGDVRVRPTVQASWVATECDFVGEFGNCGLFRRRSAPPPTATLTTDLIRLDDIRTQYLHGLRYPAERLWHGARRIISPAPEGKTRS